MSLLCGDYGLSLRASTIPGSSNWPSGSSRPITRSGDVAQISDCTLANKKGRPPSHGADLPATLGKPGERRSEGEFHAGSVSSSVTTSRQVAAASTARTDHPKSNGVTVTSPARSGSTGPARRGHGSERGSARSRRGSPVRGGLGVSTIQYEGEAIMRDFQEGSWVGHASLLVSPADRTALRRGRWLHAAS